jgi:hypothetical protein
VAILAELRSGRWRERIGAVPRRKSASIVLLARTPATVDRLLPLLRALHGAHPRLNLTLLSSDPAARARADACGLPIRILHEPGGLPGTGHRLAATLKPKLLILGEAARDVRPSLARAFADEGAALVVVGAAGRDFAEGLGRPIDHLILDQAEAVPDAGAAQPIRLPAEPSPAAVEAALAALAGPIARERERSRNRPWLRLLQAAADELLPDGRLGFLTRRKFERIDSIPELHERLGAPQTILCLGNGPSCEDPEIKRRLWDACFRVNHSWLPRGFVTDVDMVFTGSKATIEAIPKPCIFGFHLISSERELLSRCLTLRKRFAYITAERVGSVDFARYGDFAPTNGAVMLATAVRLRPRRLIIAGIDLFAHPAGSYPGDSTTPNAYTVRHDRDLETEFILDTLDAFEGELVIIGVLGELWREHQARRGAVRALDQLNP